MTQWRPVPGFEGRYEVSDDGRVASLPTRTWPTRRILAVVLAKRGGYPSVVLRANGKQYARKIHRMVCEAFNGAQPEYATLVRHIDGDVLNNAPSNLAWGNTSENLRDSVRHGTHAGFRKTHCKNGHPLSGENLVINSTKGSRQCRVCQNSSKAPFDCACGHTVTQHREKVWPRFTPRCSECDCDTYQPNYKAGK